MKIERQKSLERRLRMVRNSPSLFGDKGPIKEAQAIKLRDALIASLSKQWGEQARERQNARFNKAYDSDTAMGRSFF